MEVTNYISIYELVSAYISCTVVIVTISLYAYLNRKVYSKQYSIMLSVLISILFYDIAYLLRIMLIMYGHVDLAFKAYALEEISITYFAFFSLKYFNLILNFKNKNLLAALKIITNAIFIFAIVSLPLAILMPDIATSFTQSLPITAYSDSNMGRGVLGDMYNIRNIVFLIVGIFMATASVLYVIKHKEYRTFSLVLLAFFILMLGSIEDLMKIHGYSIIPKNIEFSSLVIGTILFSVIMFLSSIDTFVRDFMTIDVSKDKLAMVNVQHSLTRNQINDTRNVFIEMEKNLSNLVDTLNVDSKSVLSSCNISMLYTRSLLETSDEFKSIDISQKQIYTENRKKMDNIFSSFNTLKKAIDNQYKAINTTFNDIASSANILNMMQNKIKNLADISANLGDSYINVKNDMLSSFQKLDAIVETGNHVKKAVLFIKDISEKTNILSINASIQASKSGNWESSFSVVAKEISELAIDSKSAADKIDALFSLITITTKDFISVKNYIVNVFDSIIEHIHSTTDKTNIISDTIHKQLEDNEQVQNSIESAKKLNTHILNEVQKQDDKVLSVIEKFDMLDEQFKFFREQSLLQYDEIDKLAHDMEILMDLSKEIDSISQNITSYTNVIKDEIKCLPMSQ